MSLQDNFKWTAFVSQVIPAKPRQRRRAGTHWTNVDLQAVKAFLGGQNPFCQRISRSSNGSRLCVAALLVRDDGSGGHLPATDKIKSVVPLCP